MIGMETDRKKKNKELASKNNNIIEPKIPQYQSTSRTDTDDTILALKLMDTLVPTTEEKQKEEQEEEEEMENNSENDS